jgi:hypothetical protein
VRNTLTGFILGCLLMSGVLSVQADSRPPIPGPVFRAVRIYWHTKKERVQAFDVASCETGGRYNTTARNGQYENIFQMGYSERRHYGWHVAGSPAWMAARAAYRYYVASGRDWSPWECKPRWS